jgi:hypothetical protein
MRKKCIKHVRQRFIRKNLVVKRFQTLSQDGSICYVVVFLFREILHTHLSKCIFNFILQKKMELFALAWSN